MVRIPFDSRERWRFVQMADYAYRAEDYDRLYVSRKCRPVGYYTPPPMKRTRNGKRRNEWKRERSDIFIEKQKFTLNHS